MIKKSAEEMADFMIIALKNYFGDRVDSFRIENVMNEPARSRCFWIKFKAYDYFPIILTYDVGSFGCTILIGKHGATLRNSQQWWEKANLDVFLKELKEEIELRIPEKFLKAKGWL